MSINLSTESKVFYKSVFALVLPMALQNLINVAVTSADVIMLGKVGETALSGSSLAGQVQFILTLFFFGLTSGAAILTAQYWGRAIPAPSKSSWASPSAALIVGIIFTAAVLLFPYPIMRIFSPEKEVIEQGARYLRVVAPSYLFMSITIIYLNIMRSVERVIISTVVYLVSLFLNIILNAIFIFGLLGCPAMGIAGAALGTTIARGAELAIVLLYSARNKVVRFRARDIFVRDKPLLSDFVRYSLPSRSTN
ncbi:MAG: MATE family efflux transporter [Clostridia bacterium]